MKKIIASVMLLLSTLPAYSKGMGTCMDPPKIKGGCTLGGLDTNPMSGAAGTEVKTRKECVTFCEETIHEGVSKYPAWREKAYLYRCAYDGEFIPFKNIAPVPTDQTLIKKHKQEIAEINSRLGEGLKKAQCRFGPDGETALVSGPSNSKEDCLAECKKRYHEYIAYDVFKPKVSKCCYNKRVLDFRP